MYLALIHIDLFASLLRFGEVILPEYSVSKDEISDESQIPEALRKILRSGNPVEYPSQYIIAEYDCSTEKRNELQIGSVKKLIATNSEGKRSFSSQFRDDLIIQDGKYQNIFQEYLDDDFQKQRIKKGIVYFRKLCDLDELDNYGKYVELINKGITNRIKYRHHYQLPPDMRDEPYTLMLSYDRYAPYPKGSVGYFFDVIELFCYHRRPELGYSASVIEKTDIYKKINKLSPKPRIELIEEKIKSEPFTQQCDEFYRMKNGHLVPFFFFYLRDKLCNSYSYFAISESINKMKEYNLKAFNKASIFIGGFFGYEKFYDDYYTKLNLPILKSTNENKTNSDAYSTSDMGKESKVETSKSQSVESDTDSDGEKPEITGTDLYYMLHSQIEACLDKNSMRKKILEYLDNNMRNDKVLNEIWNLFLAEQTGETKKLIKKHLDCYPKESIKNIQKHVQETENK